MNADKVLMNDICDKVAGSCARNSQPWEGARVCLGIYMIYEDDVVRQADEIYTAERYKRTGKIGEHATEIDILPRRKFCSYEARSGRHLLVSDLGSEVVVNVTRAKLVRDLSEPMINPV